MIMVLDAEQRLLAFRGLAEQRLDPATIASEVAGAVIDRGSAAVVLAEDGRDSTYFTSDDQVRLETVVQKAATVLPVLDLIIIAGHRWRSLASWSE
jgi:hypothetical protein